MPDKVVVKAAMVMGDETLAMEEMTWLLLSSVVVSDFLETV